MASLSTHNHRRRRLLLRKMYSFAFLALYTETHGSACYVSADHAGKLTKKPRWVRASIKSRALYDAIIVNTEEAA